MKSLLSLILIISTVFSVLGQMKTFQASYDIGSPTSDNGISLLSISEGHLIVSATLCTDTNGNFFSCIGMLKVDTLGNVIWKKIYENYPASQVAGVLKRLSSGEYMACGYSYSQEGFKPLLMKVDTAGELIWIKYYEHPLMQRGTDFEILSDGRIKLFGHGSTAQYYQHAFVMMANHDGEMEWIKTFDIGSPQYLGGGRFSILPNGDMAFGYRNSPVQDYEETLALTKTDSSGNVLWTKTYQTNPDVYCPAKMTPLQNGGFVMSYCTADWQVGQLLSDLYGVDSLGNIVWKYTFDPEVWKIYNINTASNGDVIGCGFRSVDGEGWLGWLFRISQDGELLWQRAYRPVTKVPGETNSDLNDLVETPDGGIAATGAMLDSVPDGSDTSIDVWLLKVDADGCLEPGCTEEVIITDVREAGGILRSERQVFFRVSPNPVAGVAKVSFFNPSAKDAELRVVNGQGVEVRRQAVPYGSLEAGLDFSGLPPGLYSVLLSAGGRVLQAEKVIVI